MGSVARLKGDLDDVEALLEIISVLKDVSTNRFFAFAQKKRNFARFLEVFMSYFDLLEAVDTTCPLVRNNNDGMDIVVLSSEAGFMSQLNGRVSYAAFQEYQKHPEANVICIGKKGADKCKMYGMKIAQLFSPNDFPDRYQMALAVRDVLVKRMLEGQSGKAIVIHMWAKTFSILKPRVLKLLPASDLVGGEDAEEMDKSQKREVRRQKHFIQETTIDNTMKALADIWVSSRLYEIISDMALVEAAAQAQQLESSIEGLSTERNKLRVSFRKASRDELNKAMREVFTQSSMAKNKGKKH